MSKQNREPEDFSSNTEWVEVGRIFEPYFRKHGGIPVPSAYARSTLELFFQVSTILSDDGYHYRRTAILAKGQPVEPEERMVFEFWREKLDQTFFEIDADIMRDHFNSKAMEGNGNDPKDLHRALSFVIQVADLHDEEGWSELTPSLSGELNRSIQTLEKYKESAPWVSDMLATALSIRELMHGIIMW